MLQLVKQKSLKISKIKIKFKCLEFEQKVKIAWKIHIAITILRKYLKKITFFHN